MKKFIIKTIIFALPLTFFIFEVFLPLNIFTYRPWEALRFKSKRDIAYPYYPNRNMMMYSKGDLCFRTDNEIIKQENWKTDDLGFRNDFFIKKSEIILIGDSFVTGSSLPQDSTLTNLVRNKLNTKVYNLSPVTFSSFIYLLNNNIIEKPKLIIYSIVERDLPRSIKITNKKFKKTNSTEIIKDRVSRNYLFKYLKSRITNSHGNGVPGKYNPKMFFLNGINQEYHYKELDNVVSTLSTYKKYCDSIGVDFLFIPMPNKETVYYKNVPFKNQPNYLLKLDSLLNLKGITKINTLDVFNNYVRKNSGDYLYQLDDTHWNSNGVKLIADEISKFVKKSYQKKNSN